MNFTLHEAIHCILPRRTQPIFHLILQLFHVKIPWNSNKNSSSSKSILRYDSTSSLAFSTKKSKLQQIICSTIPQPASEKKLITKTNLPRIFLRELFNTKNLQIITTFFWTVTLLIYEQTLKFYKVLSVFFINHKSVTLKKFSSSHFKYNLLAQWLFIGSLDICY